MLNQLVVQGKSVVVNELPSARSWIGSQFGIVVPKPVKGTVGMSMKDVKAAITAKLTADGKTEDEIKTALKEANKQYDANRTQFHIDHALINGQLAADPTLRKQLRVNRNKKGEVMGATCSYRREKKASLGAATQIAQLTQLVEQLTAKLALQNG